MQKCKQCEWEFPDDMRECPYCGHPVEPEDKKQKRRFNLRWHPNTLMARVKQPPSSLAPSPTLPTAPSKKHPWLVILVSTITVILLGGTLIVFVWAKGSTLGVPVKIPVTSNSTPHPAKLNVDPLLLDFGSQIVGIQKTRLLTVSNSGGQELRWSVDKGKTLRLTLDQYSGKIAAGAIPQSINVKVDTTTLTAGHYSTTINFSSNGGNAQVVVLLFVPPLAGITVTPSPTPTPTPPPVQRQMSSTKTQSQKIKATGSGQTDATSATGSLTFTNSGGDPYTYPAGSTYESTSGVQVAIDADAIVLAADPDVGSYSVTVLAHAVNPGAAGNIAAGDVAAYPDYYITVTNKEAFTGGQDAQTYTFVQQSDIDVSTTSLKNSTRQRAINDIHQQLQPNEHLVGDPECTSDISSDHIAGDRVSQATVTVTTTCKATAST